MRTGGNLGALVTPPRHADPLISIHPVAGGPVRLQGSGPENAPPVRPAQPFQHDGYVHVRTFWLQIPEFGNFPHVRFCFEMLTSSFEVELAFN